MRIVVAGAGKLGYSVAELLADDEFDVVVIEDDPKRKDVVQNSLDVLYPQAAPLTPPLWLFLQIIFTAILICPRVS